MSIPSRLKFSSSVIPPLYVDRRKNHVGLWAKFTLAILEEFSSSLVYYILIGCMSWHINYLGAIPSFCLSYLSVPSFVKMHPPNLYLGACALYTLLLCRSCIRTHSASILDSFGDFSGEKMRKKKIISVDLIGRYIHWSTSSAWLESSEGRHPVHFPTKLCRISHFRCLTK